MALRCFGLTDVGRAREGNEDSILLLPEHNVGVVCDGMGGHEAGEVASRTAVESIQSFFENGDEVGPFPVDPEVPAPGRRLAAAVIQADAAIRQLALKQPEYTGMGTTAVAALVEGDMLYVAHAGDSRAYLARGRNLHQVTIDHTVVRDLIRAGVITEAQGQNIQRNAITRALGVGEGLVVDVDQVPMQMGDLVLLCSDGLYGSVEHSALSSLVCSSMPLDEMCRLLIGAANASGGSDNISAVIMSVDG